MLFSLLNCRIEDNILIFLFQVGPGFNFTSYLDALLPRKLRVGEKVVMYALPYFKNLTKLLSKTNKR
jgi:hypothetical protein